MSEVAKDGMEAMTPVEHIIAKDEALQYLSFQIFKAQRSFA